MPCSAKSPDRHMARIVLPLLGLLACLGCPPLARAATPLAAVSLAPLVRSERLSSLIPAPGPVELRGDRAEFAVFFNVSTRVDPTSATLHLEIANSQSLVAPRSQLVVRLNDAVVAQIGLKPNAPLTAADIDLPVALLRGGGNRLTLTAAQHYTNECENPGAAELWTQIDTTRSRLTISGKGLDVAPLLSQLPDLIGPGFFGGRRFTLLTPMPADGPDGAAIALGATITEAVALRLQYQAPEVAFAPALAGPSTPGDTGLRLAVPPSSPDPGDLVLFGTRSVLAPLLGPTVTEAVGPGGFLGLYTLPADRHRLVLVVSGENGADVERAAAALGVANFPFVDMPHQTIERVDIVPGQAFGSRNEAPAGERTRFADLGFRTTTLRGVAGTAGFELGIPADYYTPDSAEAELSLNFAYGAGLRADSVVNLLLNGEFLQALALSDPAGAVLRDYRTRLPARKLRPGRNTVSFETVMTPSVAAACTPQQSRNLIFALDDTSSISLPKGEQIASLPDLKLFSATGYPYVGSRAFDVALASNDPATVAAGWTVLARLAQLTGRTLPEGHVVLGRPAEDRNVILVGAVPDIDPALQLASPAGLRPEASLPYASATPLRVPQPGWGQRLLDAVGMSARAADADVPLQTRVVGRAELGRNGLLTASRAPSGGDHAVLMLTAANRDSLWSSTQQLVQPATWYQLAGDVSVWRPGSDVVATERVGPTYHVGNRSTLYAARYYVGEYPATWIAVVLGSVLLLALVVRLALVRRRHRVFPGSSEGVP